ncbi:MAG: hypothetical protein KDC46_12250 [Thermoleophilia bacterium]|nr:hypothetical protein [Thermoleophilia bacterium]
MAKDISVEIGFSGGVSTSASIPEDQYEAFTKALTDGQKDQWFTVKAGDGGEFLVDLSSVVFIRSGARNRSIGFSHA